MKSLKFWLKKNVTVFVKNCQYASANEVEANAHKINEKMMELMMEKYLGNKEWKKDLKIMNMNY